ncbi:MAG: phenylalanine--tRNA ligase subunit beta [Candidatus Lokiarchaeota archaeon]|nr:phenylalanine--tRNA ligase subunit beta [Candidatus Lokiarchaeota archaeon]
MPTLELKIERLEKLVGKELDIKDLEYDLQWISLDLEDVNEEEQTIKVEYNPNRPDFASPEGIARALKGYYEIETGVPNYEMASSGINLSVNPEVKRVRPYIVAGVIREVFLDDDEVATLMNIQEQLHWAVGRDRKKVAIGVHDLDKIEPPFRYTAVEPESVSFVPLHGDGYPMNLEEILLVHEKGIEYAHILEGKEVYPIIFDKKDQVLSFPPIINGVITTVTDETENIFLDITGTDFEAINLALNILSTTLADMGAKLETVEVNYQGGKDIITPSLEPKQWEVSIDYVNDYIGLNLSPDEMIRCFEKVRMDAKKSKKKGALDVWVPAFRGDIMHPVDFTEDCAIGYGYLNLPKTVREGGIGEYHPIQNFANEIRKIMIGARYLEVLNFILTNKTRHYEFMNQEKDESEMVQIKNPVSKEYNTTRTTLLHKLMETIGYNRSEEKPIRIFEVGDIIQLDKTEETGANRRLHLAAATYHENADFTEIRSTIDFIITALGYTKDYAIIPNNNPTYIEGRCGTIMIGNKKIGEIGEIHPEVLNKFKLEFPVAALEINLQHFIDGI